MRVESEYPKQDIPKPENPVLVTSYKIPTELIELPSKGLVYPKNHPLRSGKIEVKYMTAKEEDILTTESFIQDGSVLDRFLQSLIVTEGVELDDLVLGDINALTIAARIHGYGPSYEASFRTPSGKSQTEVINLTELPLIYIKEEFITNEINRFEFDLPASKRKVVFKLLTQGDSKEIDKYINKQKSEKERSPILKNTGDKLATTYLLAQIISIDGESNRDNLKQLVENMLVRDSKALKDHIRSMAPGVDLSVEVTDRETKETFRSELTLGPQYFWPEASIPA